MSHCLKCGSEVKETARFCLTCGARLPAAVTSEGASTDPATNDVSAFEDLNTGAALRAFRILPKAALKLETATQSFEVYGRDAEIEKMAAALRANQRVLAWGECGIGKSAVAAEAVKLAYNAKQFPDGILWIRSVRTLRIHSLCDAIASRLNNVEITKLPISAKPAATRQFLQNRELLLVLDDLEAAESAEEFISLCLPTFMPLLAISSQKLQGFDVDVPLKLLGRDAAVALFRDRAQVSDSDEVAGKICDLLENRPLALVFAAELVRSNPARLATLYDELAEQKKLLSAEAREQAAHHLAERQLQPDAAPQAGISVGTATIRPPWYVAHADAQAALQLVYHDLAEGPRRVLTHLAASFGEATGVKLLAEMCGISASECREHARLLASRMLVMKRDGRVSLHSELHEFGRSLLGGQLLEVQDHILDVVVKYASLYTESTPEHYSKLEEEMSNLLEAIRYAEQRRKWPAIIALVDYLQAMLEVRGYWTDLVLIYDAAIRAAEQAEDELALLRLSSGLARLYCKQGNYAGAYRLYERLLELNESAGEREGVALTLHQMGLIERDQLRRDEARKYFQRSLAVYDEIPDKAGVASNLKQLGVTEQAEGKYTEAERLYQQALEISSNINQRGPEVAEILNNIGLLLEAKGGHGNYTEAMECYWKALGIYKEVKEVSNKNCPEHAGTLNNLARLHYMMGDYKKAETLYQQALENRKSFLGENHPDIGQSLNNLAVLYYTIGNYSATAPLLEQAIQIYRLTLGEEHPRYATTLSNLATLHFAMGNLDEAERLYSQALTLYGRTLGENHPEFAHILNNMGLLNQSRGNYAEAERYMQQALGIRAAQGVDHPGYAHLLNNLGLLHSAQGRYDKAESLVTEALGIRRRILGKKHPDIAQSLTNLAELYQEQGNYAAAEPLLREAVDIYRETLGQDHAYVDKALQDLAVICDSLGRGEEADQWYREALEIHHRTGKKEDGRYITLLSSLAELSRTRGKYDEAERFYQELLEIHQKLRGETHLFVVQTYLNLGQVALERKDFNRAYSFFHTALTIAKKLSDQSSVANILFQLGQVCQEQDAADEAQERYLESLSIYEKLGDQTGIARTAHHLGLLAMKRRRFEEADSLFQHSLNLSEQLGLKTLTASNLHQLGFVARHRGTAEESNRFAQKSQEIAVSLDKLERLRATLIEKFNEQDVASIISSIGLDQIPSGIGLTAKINELVTYTYRLGCVQQLQEKMKALHPDISL